MASQNVGMAQAYGGLFEAGVNAWQGFRQQKAANKWLKAVAKQEELDAKAEAEAMMMAADERLVAYHARAGKLRLDASRMLEDTENQANEIRSQGVSLASSFHANAAAHGIERSGSPLEAVAAVYEVAEYQAGQALRHGQIKADALIHEAFQLERQGSMEKMAAKRGADNTLLTSEWKRADILSRQKSPWAGLGGVLSEFKGLNEGQLETLLPGKKKPKATPKSSSGYGFVNFGGDLL